MTHRFLKLALTLAAATPLLAAYAGGWATVTLENLPEYLVAGQPTNVTFSVRQHGRDLLGQLKPTIDGQSGKLLFKTGAVATNRTGYYTATLNVPQPGDWTLTVNSGFGAVSKVTLLPIPAVATRARPAALAAAERGHRLYIAKGCISCHANARVTNYTSYGAAPNLTDTRLPKEYLQLFLANPAIKVPNKMPNLNLKPDEIAALTSFLTTDKPRADVTTGQ